MKQPYRKAFKGRIGRGYFLGGLEFGHMGLRAVEGGRLTLTQMESARRSIRRGLNRAGLVWSRQQATIPVSRKPSEVRMGKGKGAVSHKVSKVRPGHILFEVGGNLPDDVAEAALSRAQNMLPRKTVVVRRSPSLANDLLR